jgi:hypothetical protein
VDWDAPTGRPKSLPLLTALVVVLFLLRHKLSEDAAGELFGCTTATIWRYQEELEPVIDEVLLVLAEQVAAQVHREAVLVDGLERPRSADVTASRACTPGRSISADTTCRSWRTSTDGSSTSASRVPAPATTVAPSMSPASHSVGRSTTNTGYRRTLTGFPPHILRTVAKLEIYRAFG